MDIKKLLNSPVRGKTGPILLVVVGCTVIGGMALWYSPGNAASRYRRMSLPDLKQTLDQNPNDALASRAFALRLGREGDPETSQTALRSAMALNPDDPEVATRLGELLMRNGQSVEAFQLLKSVAGRFPKYLPGRSALGSFYMKNAAYVHASSEYEAILAQDKSAADAWYQLAVCYQHRQQSSKALSAIDTALRLDPDNPEYLVLKGSTDVTVGNIGAGIEETRRAAQLAPKDVAINSALVTLLLNQHRSDDEVALAEQTIGRVEQLQPDYPLLPFQHGELERIRQHWLPAALYLEKALVATPRQNETYFALSQVYRRLNRTQEADRMMGIFQQRQQLDLRIGEVRIALSEHPNDPDLYAQLANLQLRLGDRDGARINIRAGLAIDPANARLQMELRTMATQVPSGKGTRP